MPRTLELPDALYAKLQSLAIPFEDRSPLDVIERLIASAGGATSASTTVPSPASALQEGGLASAGVVIPNGLKLRFTFRGETVDAEVRASRIWIGDQSYTSPSSAAGAAAAAVGSPGASLNGWTYWHYYDEPRRQWKPLDALRSRKDVRRRGKA